MDKENITIIYESNYQLIMKWKELLCEGEKPPFNIYIPKVGIYINCDIEPEANGYTVHSDKFMEERC